MARKKCGQKECQECIRLHKFILALSNRLAAASEALSKVAEKKPVRNEVPSMYTTHPTMGSRETFVLDSDGSTFAICVGDNHAENAERIADLLNAYEPRRKEPCASESMTDYGENGAG